MRRFVFRFPLTLWQVGINHVRVRVETRTADRRRFVVTATRRFRLAPQGAVRTSELALGVPIRDSECLTSYFICKDADQDGLLDLWENLAVDALRPVVAFDEDEELFEHRRDKVRIFVRASRLTGTTPGANDIVVFRHVVAFSRDYGTDIGPISGWGHNGDTEQFHTYWVIDGARLRLAATWFRGHHGDICSPEDRSFPVRELSIDTAGRIEIYAEENKHGLWPSSSDATSQASTAMRGGGSAQPR